MELEIMIINGILATITFGIFGTWIYFIRYVLKSLKQSPALERIDTSVITKNIKVSVILPARNEEKYIAKCLESLINQDYVNFEIIAINDSSTDRTIDIMRQYARKSSSIVIVNAKPKPEGWIGKNWACYEGYLRATGDVFLFTDADTVHSPSVMSLAVGHLEQQSLEALTAIPKLLCKDVLTKITLPLLLNFLHSRFSALRVNDPKTKTGYFFGSFYIITRRTYEAVGTHKVIRHELVEDGALGSKVKEGKFRMKMVRGERYIEAIWARDLNTLWHGLRRLMISICSQNTREASLMTIAIFFLLLEPFLLISYSLMIHHSISDFVSQLMLDINLITIAIVTLASAIQSKFAVFQNPLYALACPLGGAIISLCFLSSILDAKKVGAVNWRGRKYTINENQHPLE
ncbi:MAG: glycosyltransferase [Nitrososphaeraceae archaeon]|nr:glycosyltransferase [Nitrososphaeraceae archaeon]MBV9667130.1 glycosyltransferase [Nitrososphaeraceae archaeon]